MESVLFHSISVIKVSLQTQWLSADACLTHLQTIRAGNISDGLAQYIDFETKQVLCSLPVNWTHLQQQTNQT